MLRWPESTEGFSPNAGFRSEFDCRSDSGFRSQFDCRSDSSFRVSLMVGVILVSGVIFISGVSLY